MTEPPARVREMQRVTRPGGTVAAAVWDYAGEMTILRRFWDAAVALDPSAANRDEGRCMPFWTPDRLGEHWSTAGLAEVRVSAVVVAAGYDNFEDLRQPLERGVAPSGACASSLPSERRMALKAELRRHLRDGSEPSGRRRARGFATGRAR